jgi:hypothetical protein
MAPQERTRAVVRIDDPAERRGHRPHLPGLLADERARQQREQAIAEHELDLLVDLGLAAVTGRRRHATELSSQ